MPLGAGDERASDNPRDGSEKIPEAGALEFYPRNATSSSPPVMDSLLNDIDIDSLVPLGAEDALLALDEEDVRLLDDCHKHDGLLLDLDLGVAEAYLPSPESDMTRVVGGSADVGHVEGVQASQVTPATSESYYGHNGNHSNSASGPMGAPGSCEEEERRQLRMKKNRENAYLSRIRKKQQVENLESACRSLAKQNAELNVFVQRLAAENFLLRGSPEGGVWAGQGPSA